MPRRKSEHEATEATEDTGAHTWTNAGTEPEPDDEATPPEGNQSARAGRVNPDAGE